MNINWSSAAVKYFALMVVTHAFTEDEVRYTFYRATAARPINAPRVDMPAVVHAVEMTLVTR